MNNKSVYRYYKIAINVGPFSYYSNTSTIKVIKGFPAVFVGIIISLATICLGFLGFNIYHKFKGTRNAIEALHINLTGGEDLTKEVEDSNYDERTVYVNNNILRQTSESVSIETVELVLDIQDLYEESNTDLYSDANIGFVNLNLTIVGIQRLPYAEMRDVFDTLDMYKQHIKCC